MRRFILSLSLFCLLASAVAAQEEYTFDLSQIEKKPFEFGGYLEFRPVLLGLDQDSNFYLLRFYGQETGKSVSELNLNALLDASYERGIFKAKLRTNTLIAKTFSGWSHGTSLYEAFLSIQPSLSFTLDVGKRRLKWGKGYAWNPVAFIDRIKNPNEPDLAMEGFVVLSLEYIKSFPGILRTLSVTPVLIPVYGDVNSEMSEKRGLNIGGKVYLLLYDTDIDIMFLAGKSMPARLGVDFSRNITSNLEVHGEWAYIPRFKKRIFGGDGLLREDESSSTSFLLGARYLTALNTTFFLEYYKNGTGFSESQMEDYHSLIERAGTDFLLSGDDGPLKALAASGQAYRAFSPLRDYLYLRISQKEPWNILYFIPSVTGIMNLGDRSFSLAAELLYNPVTNMELRAKMTFLSGKRGSEFGEKQNNFRLEFRGRFYF